MAIDRSEVASRFDYHPPSTEDVALRHQRVRLLCDELAGELLNVAPESRELSLALTNLEQVCMWANAAVARHQ